LYKNILVTKKFNQKNKKEKKENRRKIGKNQKNHELEKTKEPTKIRKTKIVIRNGPQPTPPISVRAVLTHAWAGNRDYPPEHLGSAKDEK
jgi:hypothetical protein